MMLALLLLGMVALWVSGAVVGHAVARDKYERR